jgi:HEAT repeat protein
VVVPVMQADAALKRKVPNSAKTNFVDETIRDLGGRDRAAAKLSLYLRAPEKVAQRKTTAIAILGYCGGAGVPALLRVLHGRHAERMVRIAAAQSLAHIDPEGRAALLAALHDPDREVRFCAVLTIGSFALVDDVAAMLGDPDQAVRIAAVHTLASMRLHGRSRQATDALCAALSDGDPLVRQNAAAGLRRSALNYEASTYRQTAAAALEKALGDESVRVRVAAARALHVNQPQPAKGLVVLAAALTDGDPLVRAAAAEGIGWMWWEAKDAVPALVAALGDVDAWPRICAAEALGRIGDERGIEPLAALLSAADQRVDAARALARGISTGAEGSTRLTALAALATMGPAAAKAVPIIEPLLQDGDEKVRNAAASALKQIRGQEPPK